MPKTATTTPAYVGKDILQGQNVAEIQVGAQSHRIPLILILDAPYQFSQPFENAVRGIINKFYTIQFPDYLSKREQPPRISLTIFSSSGGGCLLLPPRLLHPRPQIECGMSYFTNRSWISEESINNLLFPLPLGEDRDISGITDSLTRLFHQGPNNPAAYSVNNGDSECIVIIMSMRDDNNAELICQKLQTPEMRGFIANCDSICLWKIQENQFELAFSQIDKQQQPGIGMFEWLNKKLCSLAGGIDDVFSNPTRRPQRVNIFPDAVLSAHRGILPTASLNPSLPCTCCSPVMLAKRTVSNPKLEMSFKIELPENEELRQDNISIALDAYNRLFAGFTFNISSIANASPGYRLYHLIINCTPMRWDSIYTGLNFKSTLTINGLQVYTIILYSTVWMGTSLEADTELDASPSENNAKKTSRLPRILSILFIIFLCLAGMKILSLKNSLKDMRDTKDELEVKQSNLEKEIKEMEKIIENFETNSPQKTFGNGENFNSPSPGNNTNETLNINELFSQLNQKNLELEILKNEKETITRALSKISDNDNLRTLPLPDQITEIFEGKNLEIENLKAKIRDIEEKTTEPANDKTPSNDIAENQKISELETEIKTNSEIIAMLQASKETDAKKIDDLKATIENLKTENVQLKNQKPVAPTVPDLKTQEKLRAAAQEIVKLKATITEQNTTITNLNNEINEIRLKGQNNAVPPSEDRLANNKIPNADSLIDPLENLTVTRQIINNGIKPELDKCKSDAEREYKLQVYKAYLMGRKPQGWEDSLEQLGKP